MPSRNKHAMRLFLWLFLSSALAFNSYTQSVATSASLGPALKKGVGYHQNSHMGRENLGRAGVRVADLHC